MGGPAALAASLVVAAGVETGGDLSVAGNTTHWRRRPVDRRQRNCESDLTVTGKLTAGGGGSRGKSSVGGDLAVAGNTAVAGQLTAVGAALT